MIDAGSQVDNSLQLGLFLEEMRGRFPHREVIGIGALTRGSVARHDVRVG